MYSLRCVEVKETHLFPGGRAPENTRARVPPPCVCVWGEGGGGGEGSYQMCFMNTHSFLLDALHFTHTDIKSIANTPLAPHISPHLRQPPRIIMHYCLPPAGFDWGTASCPTALKSDKDEHFCDMVILIFITKVTNIKVNSLTTSSRLFTGSLYQAMDTFLGPCFHFCLELALET